MFPLSISDNFIFSWKTSSTCLRPLSRLQSLYNSFNNVFQNAVLQKLWPIQLALDLFIVCRKFFSLSTFSNIPSFFTRLVQLILSILPQHQISELPRYIWSIFRNVQVWAPKKAMLQMKHFINFFLNYQSSLVVKIIFFLLNASFAIAFWK